MTDIQGTAVPISPANIPGKAKTRATTWTEILVCSLIVGLALYVALFAALLADAMFFQRNLLIKPIENNLPALRTFISIIYYPQILLLRLFRVIPG
jgi:hypothetical protein